jgi:peptidyl-tRNA hydrolase, PTH1 family
LSTGIELLVGLGNPGPAYAETRHNAGFWFLDRLARRHALSFREHARFYGHVARLTLDGGSCWLLKPMSFMNRSGQGTAALANFYRIPPTHILVVHDELDLPPGTVRLKQGGGSGGNKGLGDIIACLGDRGFSRLRLGVGHPGQRDQVTPYLLSRPSETEREAIVAAIEAALELLPAILSGESAKVMNQLHRKT